MKRLILLALLAALTAAPAAAAFTTDKRLDGIVSWIAQRPVQVHCETAAESAADPEVVLYGAAAYVIPNGDLTPGSFTTVAYPFCNWAVALLDKRTQGLSAAFVAFAVLVITHESFHMRGEGWWRSEAQTECHAIRHYVYAAERFGVTPDAARLLLHYALYWDSLLPPAYQLRGCVKPRA